MPVEVPEQEVSQAVWRGETMKTKLDSFERQIEKSADSYRPVSKNKRRKLETILARVRKSRSVNIRIAENVLEELKRRS
jgi:predicted DNA binding CopG/RHH family protein